MKHNFLKATAVLAATTFSVISSETISPKNHKSMRKYIITLVSVLFSLLFGISLSAQEFFRIAAHDSSEESKKSADIVCTGEHDELTIQKVLDGFDGTMTRGCHILFYDGNYNIDGFYTDPRFPMPTALRVRKTAGVVLRGIDESSLRKNSGVLFNVRPQAYEGIAPSVQMNVIACSNDNMYNTNHLTIRNLSIILPDINHKVICINTFYAGAAILENIRLSSIGCGPGKMPVEGSVGVRGSNINPNGVGHHWNDVLADGFYEAFQIGGEHLVATSLLGYRSYYGYTFGNYDVVEQSKASGWYGVWEHPITLINCSEEGCASLPLFNVCGGSRRPHSRGYQVVDLISHTVEFREKENPTLAPVLPARETVPGSWCGNITFCGNKFAESMENAVDVPFWEKGSGERFFTRNSAHSLSGTSAERESYMPMYMQQYYDTDLEKLLIYNGSDWVDTMGNAAEPLKPSFDRALIPQPVFDAEPGYVELYWKAWEQAYAHVKWQKGLVQPLYMDEGLWDDTIWIWDSEFMVMFCKYAPKLFPGIQTLDNFYYTMLEDSGSSLRIQHPDNPPFFAWVENDYYKITGDRDHIRELLLDKKFLQRYWDLFPTLSPERKLQFDHYPIALKYKGIGYEWNGISSGMDNTPRTRAGKGMLWVDAISQQALSALYISRLAKVAGDGATAREFEKKWKELRRIVNKYYWDDSDGCYYDIVPTPSGETASVADVQASPSAWRTTGILTPASFWPMLAEIPSEAQARRMTEFALRPDKLGGEVPWVTVSRDDPDFDANDGWYWRGAMWLPTAYMGIKALEKYDFMEAADTTAEQVLSWMLRTWRDYEPHTIWECYSPTAPAPSSNHGKRVRPDFCGWSALGPISLFIENVLGFHDIDASSRTLRWDIRHDCRHGLNNLTFGGTTTDLLYDPAASTVTIRSNKPYCLILNGKSHRIRAGVTTISI